MKTYELKDKYPMFFNCACQVVYLVTTKHKDDKIRAKTMYASLEKYTYLDCFNVKLSKRELFLMLNYYCKLMDVKYSQVMSVIKN